MFVGFIGEWPTIALGIHSSHVLLINCLAFAERIYSSVDCYGWYTEEHADI